jgi:hypothetical protein
LFGAVVAGAITILALAETQYVHWLDNALSNGHGPYEISLALAVAILILYNIVRIGPSVQRVFLATQITIVDKLILAAILWGLVLWIAAPWYLGALPSIEWGRLSHVITTCQTLWTIGLIWLVLRIVFGLYQVSTRKAPVQKPRLLSDNPIGRPDEDLIGRANVVNQITSVIRDFDSEGSFVIAVTGDWGTGKTSALNLVLQELKEDKSIIPVMFDPWYLSVGNGQDLNAILKRFFDTLEDAIRSRVFRPNISKILSRYYKAIAPVAEKSPIRLDFLFDERASDLEAIKKELNANIKQLGAKILVVIDDLDRMDVLEIAYVFKLIRLCVNFDNVIYVVVFDRLFIQGQLMKEFDSEARAKDYIDKIVQLELPLPKVEPTILDMVFSRYLREAERQLNVALLQDQDFIDRLQSVFNPYILYLLNNIRLIKLFINRYLLVVPVVKGEVNYFDLLVLEIVRQKYPQVYEAIYRHPEYFTYRNSINWAFPSDNKDKEVAQFFESVVASLDTESREAILSLLGSVFNSVHCYHRKLNIFYDTNLDSSYYKLKSAAHPYYFPRYFTLAVQQGAFPDVAWDNFIAQINTATEDQVKQLIDTTIGELLRSNSAGHWLSRMRLSVPKINRQQIPALLLATTNRAKDFSDESAGSFDLGGDYRLMNFLVVDLLEQLEPEQVEDVAMRLIESCPDVSFLHDLMYWFEPDRAEGEHAEPRFPQVDFQKLKQFASARLRKAYIEDGRNILTESHHHGGLYALKYFLEPAEYRSYIQQLLEQDGKNALLFLTALTSHGHWSGGTKGGTFRILDYLTAKSFVEPRRILAIAEGFKPISEMSEDEAWAVDALREGIEAEAEGKTVERISEFDQKKRNR